MTDLEANANMNNRKRKQKTHNQPQKSSKLHCSEHALISKDGVRSVKHSILCIQEWMVVLSCLFEYVTESSTDSPIYYQKYYVAARGLLYQFRRTF
ncbi:hypothetical protein QL285_068931 [Trifolium repens]|nr:hypothetical protein QL285_068931 [Trifolium repens]